MKRGSNNTVPFETIPEPEIRKQLTRILSSPLFAQSERLSRFLRFTIETVLNGSSGSLKEYVIGTEVYDRKPLYHPGQDGIVRTEARRLRAKLKDYYETEGITDPILICFKPGSYVPVLHLNEALSRKAPPPNSIDSNLLVEGKGISIAVIPFKDISGQTTSASFAVAITDELIHQLMRTEGCRVTSGSAVGAFEQQGLDLPLLAQKLGVQIFFEGSVRQETQCLRVTARIIAADGFQLWSQRFETAPEPHELSSAAEQIARSLINRTRPELSSIRKLKASAGSDIWESYPKVLGAEALLDEGTPNEIQTAIARLKEVLETSPRYPRPLCDIAQAYYELALRGVPISAPALSAAKENARQAAELDPELAQAHACIAALHSLEWNWKEAAASFHKALLVGPHSSSYRQYALFLAIHKRFDEAWDYLRKAQHADSFSHRQQLAWTRFFYVSRRYRDVWQCSPGHLVHSNIPSESRLYLALIHIAMDQPAEALAIAHDVHRCLSPEPALVSQLAEVFAHCGESSLANELAHNSRLFSADSGISRFRQSLLALALDRPAEALSLLSSAYRGRDPELIWLPIDPRLDRLRETPDFIAISQSVCPI